MATRGEALLRALMSAEDDGGSLDAFAAACRAEGVFPGRGGYSRLLALAREGALSDVPAPPKKATASEFLAGRLDRIARLHNEFTTIFFDELAETRRALNLAQKSMDAIEGPAGYRVTTLPENR